MSAPTTGVKSPTPPNPMNPNASPIPSTTLWIAIARERCAIVDRVDQPVEPIDDEHDVGRLRRRGRAARAHRDADVGRRERRRVVQPVADHHHDAVARARPRPPRPSRRGHARTGSGRRRARRRPIRRRRDDRRSPSRRARSRRGGAIGSRAACRAGSGRRSRGRPRPRRRRRRTRTRSRRASCGDGRRGRGAAAARLPSRSAAFPSATVARRRRPRSRPRTARRRPPGTRAQLPRSRAARTIAVASTCGETWSSEAASRSSSSGPDGPERLDVGDLRAPRRSACRSCRTAGSCARASVSSAPPPLTMIPRLAAREMPATIAIGTARINGHGVATTSTDSARTGSPVDRHATAGDHERDRDEDQRVPVGEPHGRRPLPLRLLHEPHDPGVGAVRRGGVACRSNAGARVHARPTGPGRRAGRSTGRDSPVSADSSSTASPSSTPSTGTTSPGLDEAADRRGRPSSIGRVCELAVLVAVDLTAARARASDESSRCARRSA